MSDQHQLVTLGVVAIAVAAPVLWAALGELVAEKGGIINPGIEGVMLVAALAATTAYRSSASMLLAVLAALAAGLVAGLLFAYLFVSRGVNQIITGILFNLFALGITTTIFIAQSDLARARIKVTPPIAVPLLEDLPIVGPVLFRQNVFVYGSVLAVLAIYALMRWTWLGLAIRAAGEHPRAVEAAGLNVWRVRYVATVIGAVLPAMGGAVLVLGIVGGFNPGMSSGQGFIALGIVVLARWNALAVVAGSLLFGLAQALQFQAQGMALLRGVPIEIWLAVPYLVTIAAVMLTRSSEYPRAAATPYVPPARGLRLRWSRPSVLTRSPGTTAG
ncbi:MAG TPA: ABC transporter permease [Actinomycetes bacterium]|nr:ABC transporter permease [Actinomycetes bacterium]